ncbi:MAG: RIP metalloprotease RseP [Verrucomicrobiota bacterium]|nr:RIP metalloprotease RseP [Verrucomicrobiota bacterium]
MFFSILRILFILLEVLLIFNLLIIVHELGHFLAARWRGLVVERFGIWFGKPLWKKTINGVQYSLGSVPAGGFVALPQMAPMEVFEGKNESPRETLPPISALDKIIVAIAGPLFSFGLATLFAILVYFVGRPTNEADTTTVIGYVEAGSPAEKAGLQAGDRILEVDNYPVKRFGGMVNSVTWRVVRSEGSSIPFKVERDGQILTLNAEWVKETTKKWNRSSLRQVRISPKVTPIIGEVEPGTPAAEAGLQPKDVILAINGHKIFSPVALTEEIKKNPAQPVVLDVQRAGAAQQFSMTPKMLPAEDGTQRPRIGVVWDPGELQLAHPSPSQQLGDSVSTMVNMIGALVSPKSDVKAQHFSGPVGIMRLYYLMFDSEQGWRMALWFSVLFNVNLAVLNLLPVPVLDGGHIMLALVEGVRRKPVNVKIVEALTGLCAVLIISFMLYVTFFDVQDVPWPWKKNTDSQPAATPR